MQSEILINTKNFFYKLQIGHARNSEKNSIQDSKIYWLIKCASIKIYRNDCNLTDLFSQYF